MVVVEEVEEETSKDQTGAKKTAGQGANKSGDQQKPAAAVEAAAAAPAAPAAPEMKLSQILPMVAMMGLQKYNLEEMGLVHHVEIAYVVVQVLCLGFLYVVYLQINKMADDGKKIKIPEVKQMGQVVSPAKEQTAKEYDMEKFKEALKQPVMGAVIMGGIYYKWGSLLPLVMQVLMTPMQFYESPLFQIHLLGKKMDRPFPVPPGPFDALKGLTGGEPDPAAEAGVDKKDD